MSDRIRPWVALICCLALVLAVFAGLMAGLKIVFLDDTRYTALMDRLDVYEYVGISREEQVLINRDLADYLSGRRNDLNREVVLKGQTVSCPFNERELSHMKDVRRLFDIGLTLARVFGCACAVCLIAALLFGRRRERRAGVLAALAVLAAGIAAALIILLNVRDFDALFMAFHRAVFTNDLWLLNPATDAMIRMLPEAFFESMASQGLKWGAVMAAVAAALVTLLLILVPERKTRA